MAVATVAVVERWDNIFGVIALSRVRVWRRRRRYSLVATLPISFLFCLGLRHGRENGEYRIRV